MFVVVDDNTFRVDFLKKDRLTIPDSRSSLPLRDESELVKSTRREGPWGSTTSSRHVAAALTAS